MTTTAIPLVNEDHHDVGHDEFKRCLAIAAKAREIIEAWNNGACPSFFNGLEKEMADALGYQFRVHVDSHYVRFTDHRQAMEYARWQSERGGWFEVADPSGIIGQYRGGDTTAEFEQHHDAVFGSDEGAR